MNTQYYDILSGLGSSSSRSGGSNVTSTIVDNVTQASHQSGSYSSDGTKTYSNSAGESYVIDSNGNVTYSIDTPGGRKTNLTKAQFDAYKTAVQQYNTAYQLSYSNNLTAPSWSDFERGNGAIIISNLKSQINDKAVSTNSVQSATNSGFDSDMIWWLLPLGILGVGLVVKAMKKNNGKTKRKR